jgi:hypothetical protein
MGRHSHPGIAGREGIMARWGYPYSFVKPQQAAFLHRLTAAPHRGFPVPVEPAAPAASAVVDVVAL